ncbi:MAG: hypothetical protein IJX76_08180 [Clostridia bacterium]|nr:hypothetical protein [Clostridia bacterium]
MNKRKELPVYLFTGFLEAGKTKTLQETLSDPDFNTGEPMLLIVCEEGVEEYDPTAFAHDNIFMEIIENAEDLTPDLFDALEKKHRPDRVLIEYNGVWLIDRLYQALPENWMIYQEIFVADANTFLAYNKNMRQLVFDKLQSCETVILNRAPSDVDMDAIHKIIRGANRRCNIGYEYVTGEFAYDEIEDPLPFDINAPVIEIADDDYAFWYRDLTEDPHKYVGKTVRFKGIVARDNQLPPRMFVIGRHVMTCCVDDISYCGVVCKSMRAKTLNTKDWIVLTATVSFEFNKVYGKQGPVLTDVEIETAAQPQTLVATF